jgi:hypothetical protein
MAAVDTMAAVGTMGVDTMGITMAAVITVITTATIMAMVDGTGMAAGILGVAPVGFGPPVVGFGPATEAATTRSSRARGPCRRRRA